MKTTGAWPETAAAISRQPATVIPASSAACPARWITGPSASGSLKGMPSSSAAIGSAASERAAAIDRSRSGWPAIR